uniref:Uncharacterized protein n=1 Tax=Schistocephalus solidus TaxID=70667 RepID=A0A0X3PH23_SCHSO
MTLRENLAGCKFSFSKPKVDVGLEYACRPSKNSFYLCPSDHIEVGTLWGSISQQLIQQLDPYILSTYLLRYALPVPRRSRMRSPSKLKDLQKIDEDACLFSELISMYSLNGHVEQPESIRCGGGYQTALKRPSPIGGSRAYVLHTFYN